MDKKSREKLTEAVKVIMDSLNVMGSEEEITDSFLEALSDGKCHRTIQQSFFRTMSRVIIEYGIEHKEFNDGRNVASVEFAERFEENKPYFPFI